MTADHNTPPVLLVTGGGGFLGQAIIRLARKEWPDLTIRNYSRTRHPALDAYGVEQVQGSVADGEQLSGAMAGTAWVIHCAAKAGVWGSAYSYDHANVTGTRTVIEACQRQGVGLLIHTSSPSVTFDGGDQHGIDESAPYARHFLNHYSRSKAAAEQAVLAANSPKLTTVALRPHLIWGPGDPHLVQRIAERARAGRLRLIQTKAPCLIDGTYIDNAAWAHVLALRLAMAGKSAAFAGKAYFIANGEPIPINDLITRLADASGSPGPFRQVPLWAARCAGVLMECAWSALRLRQEPLLTRFVAKQLSTHHWFSLEAARRDLGYTAKVSTDEGLRRLAQAALSVKDAEKQACRPDRIAVGNAEARN